MWASVVVLVVVVVVIVIVKDVADAGDVIVVVVVVVGVVVAVVAVVVEVAVGCGGVLVPPHAHSKVEDTQVNLRIGTLRSRAEIANPVAQSPRD